jgi:parallel beta-helix repeat protein
MKPNITKSLRCALLSALLILNPSDFILAQGPLTPPGAPAPTMKTLDQIEPRTPISSLPFTITNSGSYYLTGNLTSAGGGIIIQTDEVTLDLMGFTLSGGTGSGIYISGNLNNIVIRNGTVRDWTNGIDIPGARNSQLESLRVFNNGTYGIRVGSAIISHCEAFSNGGEGIGAGATSVVRDCISHDNGGPGITVNFDSAISNCVARQNTGAGIITIYGNTVKDCTANFNTAGGIIVGEGCTVTGCTAKSNGADGIAADGGSTVSGCTSTANTGDGIEVTSSCRVVENTCQGNGAAAGDGAGIHASSSRNRIDSNTVMGNDRGIDCNPASTNLIIRNSARGNTTNYDLVAGNNSGAIILSPGVGFSATNPWANFEF